MTRLRAQGKMEKAKGKLREGWGKATGNRRAVVHGKMEQAHGGAKQSLGKARAKIRSRNHEW